MAKDGLTKEQVEHIAKLANLPLGTSETQTFQEQLSEVVEYVQKISNIKYQILNIRKIPKAGSRDKGREDMADTMECLSQEDALSGTENKHNGLFVTVAVFEE